VPQSVTMTDMVPISASGPWRLDHVGYVVADLQTQSEGFCRSMNCVWDGRIIHDPIQKVYVTFLRTASGNEPQIELVAPAGEGSPVTRFLEKGGGLHHLCYEVGNLELRLEEMRSQGCLPVKRPQPAVAFGGRRIAWVLTREKLLIELLECEAPNSD